MVARRLSARHDLPRHQPTGEDQDMASNPAAVGLSQSYAACHNVRAGRAHVASGPAGRRRDGNAVAVEDRVAASCGAAEPPQPSGFRAGLRIVPDVDAIALEGWVAERFRWWGWWVEGVEAGMAGRANPEHGPIGENLGAPGGMGFQAVMAAAQRLKVFRLGPAGRERLGSVAVTFRWRRSGFGATWRRRRVISSGFAAP